MSSNGSKTYVVWKGRTPGIYHSWKECEPEVRGVPAVFKSYKGISDEEAEEIYRSGPGSDIAGYGRKQESTLQLLSGSPEQLPHEIPPLSWAVDAATSRNPGPMEYRCVEIETREVVFASKVYPLGTNNIGEFLAIVHAMALMEQRGESRVLFSDSQIAISWVRKKTCRSRLPRTPETAELYAVIDRALAYLQRTDLYRFDLRKWPTEELGEIPADYGRK